MTSLRGVWVLTRISTRNSIANSGKKRNRMSSTCNPFQDEAMNLDCLLERKVDSDDCYCLLKSMCSPPEYKQRLFPLHEIYDYGKYSGLDHDKVYIIRHVNGIDTIKASISKWTQAQPVYANIRDSDNSGQKFIHKCEIGLICTCSADEDSNTEPIVSILITKQYLLDLMP